MVQMRSLVLSAVYKKVHERKKDKHKPRYMALTKKAENMVAAPLFFKAPCTKGVHKL